MGWLTLKRNSLGTARRDHRLCWQAASVLLAYPDEALEARLMAVADALSSLTDGQRVAFEPLLRDLQAAYATGDLLGVQARYVDTFDHRRRRTLFLTYWTAGDTRGRGMAILRFADAYRSAGATPPKDELADHLAVVLEFAATVDAEAGATLLAEHSMPLKMLADALASHTSLYAAVVRAVADTVPAPGPDSLREARRLVMAGPPVEAVGLEMLPYPTVGGRP